MEKVGVIGAGVMGSGISQKIAQEGMKVVMVDKEDRFLRRGMESIEKTLSEGVEKGIFTREQKEEIKNRIKATTDIEEVRDADIVIEAVYEDIKVKKDLFKHLDGICESKTIFASNTSSFSITELASSVKRKDRFLGLHFFYHPAKNRLVEIVPGKSTHKEVISLVDSFSKVIGKVAIHVHDSPGFAVNRFFVPWLNEATRLLEEGTNIPTIEEVAKKVFKIGMGPFELMNVTGIPIAYHSAASLGEKLGNFYSPSARLKEQFEKGEPWDIKGEIKSSKLVEERLLGVVFFLACKLVEEKVSRIEDIDRGAKIGLRWGQGPFEMMNKYGIRRVYEIVSKFAKKYQLEVPKNLKKMYEKNETWRISYVDLVIEEEVARLIINRPEAMNALNEQVLEQLDRQFKIAEDSNVSVIILEGAGKAFIAGADIQFFIDRIENNRIEDIIQFTKHANQILDRIDKSKKKVIAKLDGLALGGGAEVALVADTIVASERAGIGFPETGIGIYPGLGGTYRTAQRVGKEIAKYLIFTGKILDAKTAFSIGLVDYFVPSKDIEDILEIIKGKKEKRDLPDQFKKIKEYFSDKNIDRILSGKVEDDEALKISKIISQKAPLAIKFANEAIENRNLGLSNLNRIFSTKDALEGLRSVLEKRRPIFQGK